MNQGGIFWTPEEREKATYIARRALRRGRDAKRDIMAYMGMDAVIADECTRRALSQQRSRRRESVGV